MPINWDEFDGHLTTALSESAAATDSQLASQISSVTRMTDEEVQELFPKPADVEKLAKLMKIVKSSQDRNDKINDIVSNAQEFGGVMLTLISKFS